MSARATHAPAAGAPAMRCANALATRAASQAAAEAVWEQAAPVAATERAARRAAALAKSAEVSRCGAWTDAFDKFDDVNYANGMQAHLNEEAAEAGRVAVAAAEVARLAAEHGRDAPTADATRAAALSAAETAYLTAYADAAAAGVAERERATLNAVENGSYDIEQWRKYKRAVLRRKRYAESRDA